MYYFLLNLQQRLPEDDKVAETLEDSSCLLLQKRFRGNVGRAYAAWYKGSIQQVIFSSIYQAAVVDTNRLEEKPENMMRSTQHAFCLYCLYYPAREKNCIVTEEIATTLLQAATTIQRGVRFIWDRRATRRRLLLNASIRPMQAAVRMFVKRQQYKRLLRQRQEFVATCKVRTPTWGGDAESQRRLARDERTETAANVPGCALYTVRT